MCEMKRRRPALRILICIHNKNRLQVTVDREVVNDRTHARYIIDENVKNNVEFDLKKGVHSFISKACSFIHLFVLNITVFQAELMSSENRLQSLCNWVCAQEETNLKEV